ncbi:MAG: HypE family hydrogenase expression/formation protein, partial [Candidatus Ranarchaeia archaeon]
SDVAALNGLISEILKTGGVTALKDPTRGGLSNALNEWSEKNGLEIHIEDSSIPVAQGVRAAAEMLGIDPLEIGNEGKIVIGCVPEQTEAVLKTLRSHSLGINAEKIGRVERKGSDVILRTVVGGERIMLPPVGDPIPRIC